MPTELTPKAPPLCIHTTQLAPLIVLRCLGNIPPQPRHIWCGEVLGPQHNPGHAEPGRNLHFSCGQSLECVHYLQLSHSFSLLTRGGWSCFASIALFFLIGPAARCYHCVRSIFLVYRSFSSSVPPSPVPFSPPYHCVLFPPNHRYVFIGNPDKLTEEEQMEEC